jgi:NHLM bacteriocin system ABC transporter ATP-binding protein
MHPASERLLTAGTPRALQANAPLLLGDAESIWLIASGSIDVFAVPIRDGRPAGARMHLFRTQLGQALFGMNLDGSAIALEAVGLPHSGVVALPRSRLSELASQPEFTEAIGTLVDRWVQDLSAWIAPGSPPENFLVLQPGPEVSVDRTFSATCERGTLWVRPIRGYFAFLGRDDFSLDAQAQWFPICDSAWLTAGEGGGCLRAERIATILNDPGLWIGLERFHRMVLGSTESRMQAIAAAKRRQLECKSEADRQLAARVLSRLAAVVNAGAQDDIGTDGQDLLLETSRLVAGHLGIVIQAPPGKVKRRAGASVVAIAEASRVRVRQVALTGVWWRNDNGPLLAYRKEDERPVALLPKSATRYEMVDAATCKRVPVTAQNASTISEFAWSFYRTLPPRRLMGWDLFRYGFQGCGRDWWSILFFGLLGGLLGMLVPMATGWFFDRIIPNRDLDLLGMVVLTLIVAAAATALFQLAQAIATLRAKARVSNAIQTGLWDRVLRLPVPFFRQYASGDLATRALELGAFRQVVTDAAISTVVTSVFSLAFFGLLFWYDAGLAIIAGILFIVVLLATGLTAFRQLRHQRQAAHVQGKVQGLVLQMISGISRLRVAGAEERALAVWAQEFGSQRQLIFRARMVANVLATFYSAVPLMTALVLFAAVAFLTNGRISLGAFLAFNVAFAEIFMSTVFLGSTVRALIEMIPLYERAKPILETPPETHEGHVDPGELNGHIEISHVAFRYHADGPLILDDVSVTILPGQMVAFVGPSGAGKSTLLRLLLGFEVPVAGAIYYGHQNLSGLDKQALRRQIGVVLQDSRLLAGDILTNITGAGSAGMEEAWQAARLAGLEEDIQQLPMGMHTLVTDAVNTLSGGQRQRLLIARAVIARPRILLFDEATSALDNRTQALVTRALENLKATRIVVAQRLSTIRNADQIYVLSRGRVVEQGTFDELMRQGGLFADLVKRQSLGDKTENASVGD